MTKGKTRAATAAKLKSQNKKTAPPKPKPKPRRLKYSPQSSTDSTANEPASEKSAPTNATTSEGETSGANQPANSSSPATTITVPEDTTMAGARVPFPPFKTDDIEAWFRRVEHWFAFGKVTTEADKFALIASQIENSTVANLNEMLTPDAQTPYTNLKKKIVSIFETTTTAKINKLLSGCQLGDMKPSQLLAEMKRMGGNVGDEILRNLWAKRLPIHVQTVVAAATTSSLDEISLIADAVIDVVGTPASIVNQVTNSNNQQSATRENQLQKNNDIDDLRAAVNQLTKSFRDMQSDRSRSKSRDNQSSRDRSSSYKPPENRICRYHRKFGEKAFLCTKPCSFVPNSEPKN